MPFHRVIAGFMAQTGDGQNGNGTGGSKYPDLKAEFSNVPYKRGMVGMARKGNSNDSANSQFFIMFADGSSLNGQYTVIGEVLSGMDVVDKIKKGEPVQNPDKMVKVQVAADANERAARRWCAARALCSAAAALAQGHDPGDRDPCAPIRGRSADWSR